IALRGELLRLDALDSREQQAVIDEFLLFGPKSAQQNALETDPDNLLVERFSQSRYECLPEANLTADPAVSLLSQQSTSDLTAHHTRQQPFDFLQDVDTDVLIPLLEREHPQAIALVLAHLPHEHAGHVLARLPATIQTDVIHRLVDLEETDPHVLLDVERAVETWVRRRQPTRRRMAGMAAVSAILNASQGSARRQILNNLATHDRPLAHKLTPPSSPARQFSFAEVCDFPMEAFKKVLRAAERRSVILAVAGAPADIADSLMHKLRYEEAEWISQDLEQLGPLRLIDFDRAQMAIAELAGQLYAHGHLSGLDDTHLTAMA
ncbi:MAG TPA: FliG C-terminal domain-containing protein, partial [Pirellulales bacterium]|nr:FliG C-terminal domain-containing protein [Pirellulales bacterium]